MLSIPRRLCPGLIIISTFPLPLALPIPILALSTPNTANPTAGTTRTIWPPDRPTQAWLPIRGGRMPVPPAWQPLRCQTSVVSTLPLNTDRGHLGIPLTPVILTTIVVVCVERPTTGLGHANMEFLFSVTHAVAPGINLNSAMPRYIMAMLTLLNRNSAKKGCHMFCMSMTEEIWIIYVKSLTWSQTSKQCPRKWLLMEFMIISPKYPTIVMS